jgi:hypothetical protein
MSQKEQKLGVAEVIPKEQKKEAKAPQYRVDALVDTFWNGYMSAVSHTHQSLENYEDAYLLTLKETLKLTEGYRRQVEELKEASQTNCYLFKGLFSVLKNDDAKAYNHAEELTTLFQDVTKKLGEMAWGPWKVAAEIAETAEKRFEENSKEVIKSLREQRKSFASFTEHMISSAKSNHRSFLRFIEDTVRPFVVTQ